MRNTAHSGKADKAQQPTVPSTYGRELVQAMMLLKSAGETKEQVIRRAGLSKPTVNRLENGGGSYKAAVKLHRWISGQGGKAPTPPFVDVHDDDDYRWIEMGRQLREENIAAYRRVVTAVANYLASRGDLEHSLSSITEED